MKKATLFYHFYIRPDERGLFWNWWLDEQAGLMRKANLTTSNHVDVKMYITMPRYWTSIYGIPIYENGTDREITFEEKVREYINLRYPFISIEDVRDTGEENLFEGSTLKPLWLFSKENPDQYVAYIHTKGVMSLSPHTKCWRELLNDRFIGNWTARYNELSFNDVIGIKDKQCDGTQLSGNFWWARTNYIATLEEPIYSNRYDYEKWILSGKDGTYHIIENTGVDHFREYKFSRG